jgi:hypothetical protein
LIVAGHPREGYRLALKVAHAEDHVGSLNIDRIVLEIQERLPQKGRSIASFDYKVCHLPILYVSRT